jgi:peptidoglycan/LPS O-acetylase OafA/YrhL
MDFGAAPPAVPSSLPEVPAGAARATNIAPALRTRIPELDGLRGMAILLVLLHHFLSLQPGNFAVSAHGPFALGWCGVDLFFVLSGFLIGGILLDARDSPRYFRTFYARRVFRILPLYYLWIGGYFLFVAVLAHPEPLRQLGIYATFLQNSFRFDHGVLGSAWLDHLWSLSVEEQFYLLIPLAIFLLPRRHLTALMLATVVAAPILRVLFHVYVPAHPAAQYKLTMCRADALALGVLLAIAWRSGAWHGNRWHSDHWRDDFGARTVRPFTPHLIILLAVLAGGVAYLAIWNPSQYSLGMAAWGYSTIDFFFAGLLVLALSAREGKWAAVCRWPVLGALGRISYCLYVIHPLVNFACHKILLHAAPVTGTLRADAVTLFAAALAIALATFSWKFYEHPLLRRGHRFSY